MSSTYPLQHSRCAYEGWNISRPYRNLAGKKLIIRRHLERVKSSSKRADVIFNKFPGPWKEYRSAASVSSSYLPAIIVNAVAGSDSITRGKYRTAWKSRTSKSRDLDAPGKRRISRNSWVITALKEHRRRETGCRDFPHVTEACFRPLPTLPCLSTGISNSIRSLSSREGVYRRRMRRKEKKNSGKYSRPGAGGNHREFRSEFPRFERVRSKMWNSTTKSGRLKVGPW